MGGYCHILVWSRGSAALKYRVCHAKLQINLEQPSAQKRVDSIVFLEEWNVGLRKKKKKTESPLRSPQEYRGTKFAVYHIYVWLWKCNIHVPKLPHFCRSSYHSVVVLWTVDNSCSRTKSPGTCCTTRSWNLKFGEVCVHWGLARRWVPSP